MLSALLPDLLITWDTRHVRLTYAMLHFVFVVSVGALAMS